MAIIGYNMKWTMSRDVRERMRGFFETGLGARWVEETPGPG